MPKEQDASWEQVMGAFIKATEEWHKNDKKVEDNPTVKAVLDWVLGGR